MATRSDKPPEDPRAQALSQVWRSAFVMLALCLPVSFVLRSPILPLAVILTAAAVAFYVWSKNEPSKSRDAENEALRAKIRELEERLANVEVINRFEERLAARQAGLDPDRRQAADTAPSPPPAETH